MSEKIFFEKQLARKMKINLFIRAYRKNHSADVNFLSYLFRQITYLRCYHELVGNLNELLFHHVGIIKVRGLISEVYSSLNEVLYKPLSSSDLSLIRKIVALSGREDQLLSNHADIFTTESLQEVIMLSAQLLDINTDEEKIIPLMPFVE